MRRGISSIAGSWKKQRAASRARCQKALAAVVRANSRCTFVTASVRSMKHERAFATASIEAISPSRRAIRPSSGPNAVNRLPKGCGEASYAEPIKTNNASATKNNDEATSRNPDPGPYPDAANGRTTQPDRASSWTAGLLSTVPQSPAPPVLQVFIYQYLKRFSQKYFPRQQSAFPHPSNRPPHMSLKPNVLPGFVKVSKRGVERAPLSDGL